MTRLPGFDCAHPRVVSEREGPTLCAVCKTDMDVIWSAGNHADAPMVAAGSDSDRGPTTSPAGSRGTGETR